MYTPSPRSPHVRNAQRVLWLDLEMTQVEDIRKGRIMEVACLVSEPSWDPVPESAFHRIVHLDDKDLQSLSEWSLDHHRRPRRRNAYISESQSLVDLCKTSPYQIEDIDHQLARHLHQFADGPNMVLGGSSVHVDLAFVRLYMPLTAKYLHTYRIIDVSTLLETARRMYPGVDTVLPRPRTTHEAMDDACSSLELMRTLCQRVFVPILPIQISPQQSTCIPRQTTSAISYVRVPGHHTHDIHANYRK